MDQLGTSYQPKTCSVLFDETRSLHELPKNVASIYFSWQLKSLTKVHGVSEKKTFTAKKVQAQKCSRRKNYAKKRLGQKTFTPKNVYAEKRLRRKMFITNNVYAEKRLIDLTRYARKHWTKHGKCSNPHKNLTCWKRKYYVAPWTTTLRDYYKIINWLLVYEITKKIFRYYWEITKRFSLRCSHWKNIERLLCACS